MVAFNQHGYLDPGIHDLDVHAIESSFVHGFPSSKNRGPIFAGYQKHSSDVSRLQLSTETIIDGSFISQKNDPGDIDLVAFVDAESIDALGATERDTFLQLFSGPGTKVTHMCDAYFCPTATDAHPMYHHFEELRLYWFKQFGYDRMGIPKGVVRVR